MQSGYVGIIGLTNTGKSTLLNALVGQKISIVSKKDQTTLIPIYGILTTDEYQMVFLDTPGIQKPHNSFDSMVQNNIKSSLFDLDVIIHLVDDKYNAKDEYTISLFKEKKIPVILAINKIDLLKTKSWRYQVDEIIVSFMNVFDYHAYIPISSTKQTYLNHLLSAILLVLPQGEIIYPEDEVTNQSMKKLITDIIREKVLYFTDNDVKSGFYVSINHIIENKYFIDIVCNKENHKKMIIGTDGLLIKKIKELAKKDLQKNYDLKIDLDIFVKVDKNWKDNKNKVQREAF